MFRYTKETLFFCDAVFLDDKKTSAIGLWVKKVAQIKRMKVIPILKTNEMKLNAAFE